MINDSSGLQVGEKLRAVLLHAPVAEQLIPNDDSPQAPSPARNIFLKQKTFLAALFSASGSFKQLFQGLVCLEQENLLPFTTPVKLKHTRKTQWTLASIFSKKVVVGRYPLKGMGAGKRGTHFLKQPGLAKLAWVIIAHIIVGKDMGAMLAAHPVKGFTAPLSNDDGLSLAYGSSILTIWQPASAQNVPIGHNVWMKGQDHVSIQTF